MADLSLYQYLHETLGIRYLPRVLEAEAAPATHSKTIWQHPHFKPHVIFYNMDPDSSVSDPGLEDMFSKIVTAMNLKRDEIWYVDAQGRSFMDFLNWLKSQNLTAPLVLFKKDPEISQAVQNAGTFDWVECFSLSKMAEKPTWEMLKLLLEKK